MNVPRKRPIGITLLALVFLWIGCIGTLVFPIILFAGDLSQQLDAILAGRISSEHLRFATICIIDVVWFGAYVLYGFIGFGLWKLRPWTWKAVIIVNWICIAGGVGAVAIATVVSKQPAVFLFAIACSAPWAGILWYLYRPNVRAAFQGQSIATSAVEIVPPPPPSKGKLGLKIALVALLCFILFIGSVFFLVENMFRSSAVYSMALQEAQKAPCFSSRIGSPVATGWMASGNLSESPTEGLAELRIPIQGPNGKAALQVEAKKTEGAWHLTDLKLDKNGDQTQLLPAAACQ